MLLLVEVVIHWEGTGVIVDSMNLLVLGRDSPWKIVWWRVPVTGSAKQ